MATSVDRKPSLALWKLLRDEAFASLRDDFTTKMAECSLTLSQGKLIRELAQPQSQRELARRLHYDPSNITAIADSLEERGLIERRPDASDRRFRRLALTADGERLRLKLDARLSAPPDFMNRLTPEEQQRLLQLLTKLFGHDRGQASSPPG